MIELFLVRHGETDWNNLGKKIGIRDIKLNSRGMQQAKEIGQILREYKFDTIYSSPLKRALKTASMIQAQKLEVVEALMEIDCGPMEGRTDEQIQKIYPGMTSSSEDFRHLHNLPSMNDHKKALTDLLINIATSSQDNSAIISHKRILMLILEIVNCPTYLSEVELSTGSVHKLEILRDNNKLHFVSIKRLL